MKWPARSRDRRYPHPPPCVEYHGILLFGRGKPCLSGTCESRTDASPGASPAVPFGPARTEPGSSSACHRQSRAQCLAYARVGVVRKPRRAPPWSSADPGPRLGTRCVHLSTADTTSYRRACDRCWPSPSRRPSTVRCRGCASISCPRPHLKKPSLSQLSRRIEKREKLRA